MSLKHLDAIITFPVSSRSNASPFSQISFTEVPTLIESNNVFNVPAWMKSNQRLIYEIQETWRRFGGYVLLTIFMQNFLTD